MSFGSLAGKVTLITGASSGIGAATAKLFSRMGARLALTGLNGDNLEAVVDECHRISGLEPSMTLGDLTESSDCERVVRDAVQAHGGLDVLVNSAGVIAFGGVESVSMAQYDYIMGVNARSVFNLTQLALPHLVQSQGNVVNVSSINGLRAFAGVLTYGMAKATVVAFTENAALDLATKGVRVNCVCPGVTHTELHRRAGLTDAEYDAYLRRARFTHPLGRHGQPGEIAAAIAFLASDQASFITGVSLPVDGGRHALCPSSLSRDQGGVSAMATPDDDQL